VSPNHNAWPTMLNVSSKTVQIPLLHHRLSAVLCLTINAPNHIFRGNTTEGFCNSGYVILCSQPRPAIDGCLFFTRHLKMQSTCSTEQLNIFLNKMHEFKSLNGHGQQFLCYQQPMRQHTLDVFIQK